VVVAVDDRSNPNDGTNDALHRSTPQTVVLTVENVDDAPVFDDVPRSVSVTEDQTVIADLSATDQDLDEIVYSLVDPSDEEFFEVDPLTGVLQFRESPNFESLGIRGRNPFSVQVAADDRNGGAFPVSSITVSISNFTEPSVTSAVGNESSNENDGPSDDALAAIDSNTLPPASSPSVQNEGPGVGSQVFTTSDSKNSGADDFNYSDDGFVNVANGSAVNLGFYESYYQGMDFIQETELVSQQLADAYSSRRNIENVSADDAQLAALFWQGLDSSNEDYLQRNVAANNANIVAASAGLFSAGLLFSVYGGSIAITTLATQLPAWKSLDISPLISAFDEDEESIHEIVDG
jgi:hypothetical protein